MTAQIALKADTAHFDDSLLALCKAAGDPLRLRVLRVLRRDAFSVQELCHILDCRQSGMSHHLKILTGSGLISRRREGNSLFYRRSARALSLPLDDLHNAVLTAADRIDLDGGQRERWQQVVNERGARSQQFFAENAGQFGQHQEQMVAYDVYGPSSAELLRDTQANGGALAIEIGPGEGAFLSELVSHYSRVIALDNSEAMLDKARRFAKEEGLGSIEFLLGDSSAMTLAGLQADCVIANMVLHHLPSPADIFADVASMLRPGGLFSVTELCPHDQNWARQECGDLWLGIEPDELSEWAAAANLEEGPSIYLAQLNGFRVQVRQFIKPERHV